jgi:DNA polymerase II
MGAMSVTERLFYLLVPTYRVIRGIPVVHLFGTTDRGESVLIVDDRIRPYFYVPLPDLPAARRIADPAEAAEEPDLLDLDGRPVGRIVLRDPRDVPRVREAIEAAGIPCLEADLRFAYRYMIDRGIRGTATVRGPAEKGRFTDLVFRRPEFDAGSFTPRLKLLSIDIETDRGAREVFSVALSGTDLETVLIRSDRPVKGAIALPDERSLLEAVADRIARADPDVITGWNVVDFDLTVLDRRATELGLPLWLGRGEERLSLQGDAGFTRQKRAGLPGRQVLDGIGVVRDTGIQIEDFRLQTVATDVLGRGKLAEGGNRVEKIERAFREDPEWLAKYNLEDARLVIEILEKTGGLRLALERSLLTGMPLDRVGASVATFDFLYLPELRRKGRVAPVVRQDMPRGYVVGGTVFDARAGIFPHVVVLDFKSLYPSIIRTFGIDPYAFTGIGDKLEGEVQAPNGARFLRGEGILPDVIERLWDRRDRAKREGDKAVSTAVKLLMNSFYGVLGTNSCRFAEAAVANGITSFGGEILRRTKEVVEGLDYEVLYGDTDSVFVLTRAPANEKAREIGERIREAVNDHLTTWARETYGVESKLELELERIYHRLFLPNVRGGAESSKKRYAGLVETGGEPELRIVGLEAVRRDWPEAGRHFQVELLERVLRGRPVDDFVREFVRRLRTGDLDKDLVYRKRLRKSPDDYVRAIPPHVRAAKMAGLSRGDTVRYVITKDDPAPVPKGGALPSRIDHNHYVSRVLEPIAEAILPFVGRRFAEISGDDPQLRLF